MAGFPEPEAGLVISYSYLWKEEEERGQTEGARISRAPLFLPLMIPIRRPTDGSRLRSRRLRIAHPMIRNVAVEIPLAFISPDPPDYPSLRDLRDGRASAWLVWLLVVTVTGYSGLGSVADSVSS